MSRPRSFRPERESTALILALTATEAARGQLDRYAAMTDDPIPGTVEAADLLDAAREAFAQGNKP